MDNKKICIAFLGTLVPDTIDFHNPAFNRSGNMVQAGIVEGIFKQSIEIKVLSSQPIPAFPKDGTFFCKRQKLNIGQDIRISTIPCLNILVIREFMRGIYALVSLINWAFSNRNKQRLILVYNTYSPPLPFVYLIGKLTKSKTVAIIYDLGTPPKSLKLDFTRSNIYKLVELSAKFFIPRLDGRIVITDAIARDYAPNKHFLTIDGGISDEIICRLFPLSKRNERHQTIFLCAGSLWEGNGVSVIIESMRINTNPSVKIWFAGKGPDVELINAASKIDSRIEYKGMLNLDQLFKLYQEADVLLNIRVIPEEEGAYLFPSKLIEYLTIGKLVISTQAVHISRDYGHICTVLDQVNPKELSDYIDKIADLSNSEMHVKGLQARNYMLNNYTWDKRSEEILKYINEAVF